MASSFSSSGVCSKDMYTPGSPFWSPLHRNCMQNNVFPAPVWPATKTAEPGINPPSINSSRPGIPVLILAIDKDLFAEARVWFNTSKEINEKYSKDGQIPIPSHSISFYGLRFKESDGFYYPKTITLNQWAAVSALQTPVL